MKTMYILSSFELTGYLELALTSLEEKGISKEKVLAVPLDKRSENRRLFDTIHQSDGISLIDTGVAFATGFSVVGASVGFKLPLGPVVWGLIGAALGFLIGFIIDLLINTVWRKRQRKSRRKTPEVIMIIHCNEDQIDMVENLLWEHFALGVGKFKRNPDYE